MKKNLLLIGQATDRMVQQIHAQFNIHNIADFDTLDKNAIEAIITNGHDGVPNHVMRALPKLKIISCYGVGYDAIDVALAQSLNIMVSHTPQVLDTDVANMAILLLLASSRQCVVNDRYVREQKWPTQGNAPLTDSIAGKNVGFLGMGRIGQNIAQKCIAFAMNISYHTRHKNNDLPYRYFATLKAMAQHVDYLIIIAPGGPSTQHLVDSNILTALGKKGTLINVGRGSIVDEHALITALKEKTIKAAALDVYEHEPHVPIELCAMDNVTLQPHMASATVETRQAMGDLTTDNILTFMQTGRAITPVPEMKPPSAHENPIR